MDQHTIPMCRRRNNLSPNPRTISSWTWVDWPPPWSGCPAARLRAAAGIIGRRSPRSTTASSGTIVLHPTKKAVTHSGFGLGEGRRRRALARGEGGVAVGSYRRGRAARAEREAFSERTHLHLFSPQQWKYRPKTTRSGVRFPAVGRRRQLQMGYVGTYVFS